MYMGFDRIHIYYTHYCECLRQHAHMYIIVLLLLRLRRLVLLLSVGPFILSLLETPCVPEVSVNASSPYTTG